MTEQCGIGAASLLICPYRMRAAPDRGRGARFARGRGKLLIYLLSEPTNLDPRTQAPTDKCRYEFPHMPCELCKKKVDNCNKPVILCISQQNTQRKYYRNYTA